MEVQHCATPEAGLWGSEQFLGGQEITELVITWWLGVPASGLRALCNTQVQFHEKVQLALSIL